MGHLAEGMHTSVGSAGSKEAHLFAGDTVQSLLQDPLNRRQARLKLPSPERTALILDKKPNFLFFGVIIVHADNLHFLAKPVQALL